MIRFLVRLIRSLFPQPDVQRGYGRAMSGAAMPVGAVYDDIGLRMDRRRITDAIQNVNASERLIERGWDWDQNVPDALFFGQVAAAGPAEAEQKLQNAAVGLVGAEWRLRPVRPAGE